MRNSFLKKILERKFIRQHKKGSLAIDVLIILAILLGLLILVSIAYFGLSGKLSGLIGSIRNMLRFGG